MKGTNCAAGAHSQRLLVSQSRQQAERIALLQKTQRHRRSAGCMCRTMKGRMSSLKLSYSPPGWKRSGRQLSGSCQLLCTACKQHAR